MTDALKVPLVTSLNLFAQARALDAIQQLGKALPCSVVSAVGQIVTVNIEVQSLFTLPQVTVPTAFSHYQMPPWQAGDKGLLIPSAVYLGGISGLGGGTADMSLVANLSALLFVPVANMSWTTPNANAHVIQGPQGVILQTDDGNNSLTLNSSGMTIKVGGTTVLTLTSSQLTVLGIAYTTHQHSGVSTGSSDTGPPV